MVDDESVITEHVEIEVVEGESVNTENGDIEDGNEVEEDADEISMAEELERFEKLAGSKCHDCEQRKEALTQKDNIIIIQESKLRDSQTRLVKCGKEKSALIKEKKGLNISINKLKRNYSTAKIVRRSVKNS